MANALSDQLTTVETGATASGGLAGAPQQLRSVDERGNVRIKHASFTIPASGAGSATGDVIWLQKMVVTDKIMFVRLAHDAMGSITLSVGRVDPNNSANTDASHYAAATDVSAAGYFDTNANFASQAGDDPKGDQSTGNTAPGFGQRRIIVTATITGTPTAAKIINALIFYTEGP